MREESSRSQRNYNTKKKMVHKKYIKIKGKKYGPYYYESYREDGKVKKRYVKNPKRNTVKKSRVKINRSLLNLYFFIVALFIVLSLVWYLVPSGEVQKIKEIAEILLSPPGSSSIVDLDGNLTIWDSTDLGENRFSGIPADFIANFTQHSTGNVIDDLSGLCEIHFDTGSGYGVLQAMTYNPGSLVWEFSNTFFLKGNHAFEVSCTSGFGNPVLINSFVISNTAPDISETPGGVIDFDGNILNNDVLSCVEDALCIYNFSANVTDPDLNDILTYSDVIGPNTTLTDYTLDSATGMLDIFVLDSVNTGTKRIDLSVEDTDLATDTAILDVFVTEVNDAPEFIGLENKSFNMSFLFDYKVNVTDEEGNAPFVYNISFISCDTAPWSSRGSINCDLFDTNDFNTSDAGINISFVPTKNDVGNYYINFSVRDTNNFVSPFNATRSVIVNFTVVNINDAPYFIYVCDNERETLEDTAFTCEINASDNDEIDNLTFSSNLSWFLSSKSVGVNATAGFNGSVLVNFTANDKEVGNWSINVTVTDTGSPVRMNSTEFWFFVDNVPDPVTIQNLNPFTAYTTESLYEIYINASDNDLFIPDKTVYDEILTFTSNESWLSIGVFEVISGSNITTGLMQFDPSSVSPGLHRVNIGVNDASGNTDSFVFEIDIVGNSLLFWDVATPVTNVLIEDQAFFLNLSLYVTDLDGDPITFSYSLEDGMAFPGFNLDSDTGVIDFTPVDEDVGEHIIEINATDVATSVPLTFNFTVLNLNDAPLIQVPLNGNNIIFDSNSNGNVFEDDFVDIFMFVIDDDLRITQKGFYDETFNVNLTIVGNNTGLFNFDSGTFVSPDKTQFQASFIPGKSDVGEYNISINVTDLGGNFSLLLFNLTINEIDHNPVLINVSDQGTPANFTLYYDINATDLEDGVDELGNLEYTLEFLPDGKADSFYFGDEEVFNTTYGILNVTPSDEQVGAYHLNVTVRDTVGLTDSEVFWFYVFDAPEILFPSSAVVFDLVEGSVTGLAFVANSTAASNLTYRFYIGGNLRANFNYYGNATMLVWGAVPDYVDETYGLIGNLTLEVLIPGFEFLNASRTWGANISHADAPMTFFNDIGDKQVAVGKTVIINLSEHFRDPDVFDVHYNQSFDFVVNSSVDPSAITSNTVGLDWILELTSSEITVEILTVNGTDFVTSDVSNNFTVEFTEPTIVTVPVPTTGGGSGGSSTKKKPVSLRLLLPDPVSAFRGQKIVLPIGLVNDGPVSLKGIHLSSLLAKAGVLRDDLLMTFDKDFVSDLDVGERENVTLSVDLGIAEKGLYEITLSADVESPVYSDWGKIFINLEEAETLVERLVFTEEFVAENPECVELTELVDRSREALLSGNVDLAETALSEAINSCKEAISQDSLFSGKKLRAKLEDNVFLYLLISTIVAIILGIAYYTYRTIMFKRALKESVRKDLGALKKNTGRQSKVS